MSDKPWYLKDQPEPSLSMWILGHMAAGAGWAALVLFALIAFILIIRAVSFLLPEDPYAALQLLQAATAIA